MRRSSAPASMSRRGSTAPWSNVRCASSITSRAFCAPRSSAVRSTSTARSACCTFDIKEGPQAQITAPEVGRRRRRAAGGDSEGRGPQDRRSPYVAATSTTRAAAIEDEYRQQGFNDCRDRSDPGRRRRRHRRADRRGERRAAAGPARRRDRAASTSRAARCSPRRCASSWASRWISTSGRWRASGCTTPTCSGSSTFNRCRLAMRSNGVQPVKAVVSVEEYPEWSFRYGFQIEGERTREAEEFTSSRNLGVVGELKNANLFGRALTLGPVRDVSVRPPRCDGVPVDVAVVRLAGAVEPLRLRTRAIGFATRPATRSARSTTSQGISADQRWRRGRRGRSSTATASSATTPTIPNPATTTHSARFRRQPREAEYRDAVRSPRRSDQRRARARSPRSSIDQAGAWLGSDVNNRKLLVQQFVFVPFKQLVLASRAQFGRAFGRDDLLPSDRFRAGGAGSVRGYSEDSLGPRDVSACRRGGEKMVVLNQEARFPVYRWAHARRLRRCRQHLRQRRAVRVRSQLKIGYGLGLRLDTPVGMLRADIGFPNSDPGHERRHQHNEGALLLRLRTHLLTGSGTGQQAIRPIRLEGQAPCSPC